jgi:hypothetical protein
MRKLCMILPMALILCFMVGCQDKEAMKGQAEVEEQNETVALQIIEAFNGLSPGNHPLELNLVAS